MTITVLEALEELDRDLAATGVELPARALTVAERTSWFGGLVAAGRVRPPAPAAAGGE
jgi:hypothetical protein